VAQALLEKAIPSDPHYGQALGVLARQPHLQAPIWAGPDMAGVAPIAERAALAAILCRQRGPGGRITLSAASICLSRRIDDALAEFELALSSSELLARQGYNGLTLSYGGRWEEADLARAARCG